MTEQCATTATLNSLQASRATGGIATRPRQARDEAELSPAVDRQMGSFGREIGGALDELAARVLRRA